MFGRAGGCTNLPRELALFFRCRSLCLFGGYSAHSVKHVLALKSGTGLCNNRKGEIMNIIFSSEKDHEAFYE